MIELQRLILAAVYSEDSFKRISFLRPEDFDNVENHPLRKCFELIQSSKGNLLSEALLKTENKRIIYYMIGLSSVGVINNLERYALSLAETRLKGVFKQLLIHLSRKTKNALESNIIDQFVVEVETEDFFNLSDIVVQYLGAQCSFYTEKRIGDYLAYRNKRIDQIKSVINGY